MDGRGRSFFISSVAFVLVASLIFLYPSTNHGSSEKYSTSSRPSFRAPKENVWAELSEAEATDVYDFIQKELAHLDLVQRPKSARENSIFTLETLRPNKTDAVAYLQDEENIPQRWATAVLSQYIDHESYLVYYSVGPLPISEHSQILRLNFPFNSGRNYVNSPIQDFYALLDYGQAVGHNISDITQQLLGTSTDSDGPSESLLCFPRPLRLKNNRFVLWFQFFRPGFSSGGRTLLPQGVYVKVDASSPDSKEWMVGQYYYNGVVYQSVEEFRMALSNPDFMITPPNLDGSWTDTEDFDAQPAGRELPPPVMIQPHGARYGLDRKQKFVSWFGFEFYISTTHAAGLTLFDIRFKGQRVMYELGLQEALSHYAGDDPMAGGQEFLDTFFGMGKGMFELVPGYDCPAYADYLDTQYHMAHETKQQFNSICVFEFTADHLLSRHTAQYSVTASRNTYLVVRSVSTVGNYDYTIDYIFYMDGTLEVKVRASGYIFAAFYAANHTGSEDEYGYRINDAVSSSMHDHVINFRADLDVAGASNDMVRLALEPTTVKYSWDLPEVSERNTMHLVEYPVSHETGMDWPPNSGEFYIVYNSDAKNAWGERRGYRITSGTGMGSTPHLTIINSTTLGDSARWAEHDVWVLRRKDTEPRSADPLNYLDPEDPIVNFQRMANEESLERYEEDYDGDLVVYFNLGSHHVPHSGDLPNTLMHTSASSVMFVPHNFNDRDPSRESVQGVRLQLKGNASGGFAGEPEDLRVRSPGAASLRNKTQARYFGQTYEEGIKLPLSALEPDLTKFKSSMNEVTDLGFNGSAAGVWMDD